MLTQTAAIVSLFAARALDGVDAEAIRAAVENADRYDDRIRDDLAWARDAWWGAAQADRDRVRAIMRAEVPPEIRNDFRRLVVGSGRR